MSEQPLLVTEGFDHMTLGRTAQRLRPQSSMTSVANAPAPPRPRPLSPQFPKTDEVRREKMRGAILSDESEKKLPKPTKVIFSHRLLEAFKADDVKAVN